ncbi:SbcC/MukB-like Walker B domain-containing protein [Prosthecobacter fluviatilis]|uniref:SbcC/MukB-like Walker B domain-containing protein n=1 Tax=Prosthecobacter fluviatilis TaxID=445931 RepID=A0ABW0KSB3_9BACT
MSTKSRAIRLSRLHAINWYGYQDTLPVQGNLVLAGVTGSGKSILMDLLMLVLVGPERARHHFNRSATGTQSDRTLKGYCLLDTKQQSESGQPQFYHDKGVTTYVAAEFSWPGSKRVETWGLRIEFRNTAENDGHITPFFCPAKLEKDDFIHVSAEDGKRRTLDILGFRQLVEGREGHVFASSREYLRDMSSGAHLNFNREVLDRLLPSAMSFTNLKSFDDFCRRFVLPGEAVPVEDVVASYRDFESYENELRLLRGQLTRLQTIRQLSETRANAQRDRDVARFLATELNHEHTQGLVTSMEKRLAELRERFSVDEERLLELESEISRCRSERERLLGLMHESSEGRLYHQLTEQGRKLEAELLRLRELGSKLSDRLRKRVKDAKAWLKDVKQAPLPRPVDTQRFETALELLEGCDEAATANALSLLRDAADQVCKNLRQGFAADAEELRRLRAERSDLEAQISTLKAGLPPIEQPLLHELNSKLLQFQGRSAAHALREVCEVADEGWREAIEVAFTEKFAVLVNEEQHAEALRHFHELKAGAQGPKAALESLVHPARMLALKPKVLKGSLAEKIETDDPVARACVDHWFGQVKCVQKLADFEKHDAAILPDGLMLRDGVTHRARRYDGVPFVGKRGLQRQQEIKQALLQEIVAGIRRLEPLETEINALISDKDTKLPDHGTLAQDLVRVESLPKLEQDHEELMKRLQEIDTGSLHELEQQAHELSIQADSFEKERLEIARKGLQREIEQIEKTLATRRDDASKREDELLRVRREIDISAHLDRYQTWKQDMLEKYLAADVAAREFEKEQSRAAVSAAQAEGDLKAAMVEFKKTFSPRFDDLPEDGRSTKDYEKLLARIDGQGIPDFEKKAGAERKRWEGLFRTQVLSRMQKALKEIDNIIFLLNKQLKRQIGNDVYHIKKEPNPEFRFYRHLIDLNSTRDPDDLFFSSLEGELRTALDHFLQTLVKQGSSPEAARLLDYRQYFDYDLLVSDVRHPDAKPVSVDKQSGKMSGGENQSPYFVAILASYLHAYNRHETRWKEPSLALVPIDEAFSKLSGERIQDCLAAMQELDLQGVFSMSSGNIPFAFSLCDELIVVTKTEKREGGKTRIRNIPAVLFRDTPEGREWMDKHGS